MPLDLRESIGGIKHLMLAFRRKVFGIDAEHYIMNFAEQGMHCSALKDIRGNLVRCQICGFAIAAVKLPGGLNLETCSAVGLQDIQGNSHFQEWLKQLPAGTERGSPEAPEPICQIRTEEHIL